MKKSDIRDLNLGVSGNLKLEGIFNILLIFKDWKEFQVAIGNIYILEVMYDCVLAGIYNFIYLWVAHTQYAIADKI